ncbi:MAG: transglycosylase domain-containing protein, partial [Chromatiales bacterium]|nr:transglycosylase domain-containing protein [Chromatiales bacterium]
MPRKQRRGRRATLWLSALCAAWLGIMWSNLPDAGETRRIARSAHIHVVKRTAPSNGTTAPGMTLELVGNRFDYSLNTSLENVSPHFINAVIASEDRHFREPVFAIRVGYMLAKFAKAAIDCYVLRHVFGDTPCRGNSTVPQQLARNLLLGEHRGPVRKVRELLWAIKMEHGLGDDEILEFYVNRVYLGNRNYGVEMGSRDYFGKSASRLTRAEAAYLAAAIKKPEWNRRGDRSGALKRGRLILELMRREGYASAKDTLPRSFAPKRGPRRPTRPWLGHLWQWVRGEIEDAMRHLPDGRYKLWTTLNAEVEIYAERELGRELRRWQRKGISAGQGAAVIMRPDGDVLAMVGGVGDGVAGRGTNRSKRTKGLMPRPPASAFKPFVYLAALEQGLTPESIISAEPVDIPGAGGAWRPRNHRGERYDKVSMREGLVHSINTAAVRLLQRVGYDTLFDTLARLGLKTESMRRELGLALGSSGVPLVEMVGAYATFANGGRRVTPRGVLAIATQDGRIIRQRGASQTHGTAFAEDDIRALNDMMREVVLRGTGHEAAASSALRGMNIAGKTGTGDGFVDAWFIGYTADVVIGVWFGNDRPVEMTGLYGGTGPARTFNAVLARLVEYTDLTSA